MRKIYLLIVLTLFIKAFFGQCTLNLIASVDSVLCGECATLSAFGSMDGNIAFQEDFNSGSPTGWQFTQSVTVANNTCGVASPDGTDFMWMGDAAVNPRDMTTVALDLSLGGVICFEMRYAIQGDPSPCEGPDEPNEGVHLQYSIDNGATWIDMQYWDPNGGYDPTLTTWNQYCVILPPGAMTTSTLIQWHQDAVSGSEYDHWGIDNVQITLNDPTSQISWSHDNYNYPMGSSGGDNPTDVCISSETTYTAQITNGTNTCNASITVPVRLPTINVNAGLDQDICPGECVTLSGEAKVIISPAKTPTYVNAEFALVTGGHVEVNVNVQGLNMPTVLPNSITQVCIDGFDFSGTQICSNFGGCNCNGTTISAGSTCNLDESSFNVVLTSPSGCSVTLVPAGVATGPYGTVCFVPTGGGNITGGGFPAAGSWGSSQPLSGFDGCTSNGVWTLEFDAPGGLGFGAGTLNGWNITFDDPEISYPAPFVWSPTTAMTNELTLSPTVCPTSTQTYTLTASDSNACTSASDDVIINVLTTCCSFNIGSVTTAPTCGNNDGDINLTITNGSGNYTFDWGTNGTTEDLSLIGQGIYNVTITDVTDGCSRDTVFDFSSNAFQFALTVVNPSCGGSDGSVEFAPNGVSTPFTYSIDNGTTFVTTPLFSNLSEGTLNLALQDAAGCRKDTIIQLSSQAFNYTVNIVPPTCGSTDGSIEFVPSGGTTPFTYSIDNGSTFLTTPLFSNVSGGTYNLAIQDANGCLKDTAITLNSQSFLYTLSVTSPSCGGTDGTISFNTIGGTAPFGFSIDNGVTNSLDSNFTNLSSGTYNLLIADATGCLSDSLVTLSDVGSVSGTVNSVDLICNNDNSGRIVLTVIGGTAPYTYDIGNGVQNSTVFNNIAADVYNVTITDASGCTFDTVVTIVEPTGMTISLNLVDPTCYNTCDASVEAGVTGGAIANDPIYQWSGALATNTGNSVSNICINNYTLTVVDDNGCEQDTTFSFVAPVDVVAAFSASPQPTTMFNPEITLIEESLNGIIFTWFVDSLEVGTGSPFQYDYPSDSAGIYNTCLLAEDILGCSDSICKKVIIKNDFIVFLPNTFSPDADGDNDFFFPQGLGLNQIEYELLIFDRWGTIIWESTSSNREWDGTHKGKECPVGVYVWQLRTIGQGNNNIEKIGYVNLLR